MTMKVADVRREYGRAGLAEGDLAADPIEQFQRWLDQAMAADPQDFTAMTLATADRAGRPSARVVLLKGVDERGFVFYTHYGSRKGVELLENPRAALVFYWAPLDRQVRVEGTVEKASRAESEAYFASRPLGSRLGAWASPQSRPIVGRGRSSGSGRRPPRGFPTARCRSPTTGGASGCARSDRVLAGAPQPAARPPALHPRCRRGLESRAAGALASPLRSMPAIDSSCDVVVVGGGLLGLATAMALSGRRRVTVLEAEERLAAHQTGHNSGVIHSGIYYKPGSLKAKLCVEGASAMYRVLQDARHRARASAASSSSRRPRRSCRGSTSSQRRGRANGLPGLRELGPDELRELEPHAAGIAGSARAGDRHHRLLGGRARYAAVSARTGGDVRPARR